MTVPAIYIHSGVPDESVWRAVRAGRLPKSEHELERCQLVRECRWVNGESVVTCSRRGYLYTGPWDLPNGVARRLAIGGK